MTSFRDKIEKRRIKKLIKPLDFIYDFSKTSGDPEYLVDWFKNIDINAVNISSDNSATDVLVINKSDTAENNWVYCVSLMLASYGESSYLNEEYMLEVKKEASMYNAIPVIITCSRLNDYLGIMAKSIGIQVVTLNQLYAVSYLVISNKISNINPSCKLFTHSIARYAKNKINNTYKSKQR